MTVNRVLWALIIVTTATFSELNVIYGQYTTAITSFAFGVVWLRLEVKQWSHLNVLFFLFFLGRAIQGSLNNAPIPIILLGLSTDLAAWDLSRFRARLIDETDGEVKTLLGTKHLQRLAPLICAGFLIALLPTIIKTSFDFVVVFLVMLLTMITLRK